MKYFMEKSIMCLVGIDEKEKEEICELYEDENVQDKDIIDSYNLTITEKEFEALTPSKYINRYCKYCGQQMVKPIRKFQKGKICSCPYCRHVVVEDEYICLCSNCKKVRKKELIDGLPGVFDYKPVEYKPELLPLEMNMKLFKQLYEYGQTNQNIKVIGENVYFWLKQYDLNDDDKLTIDELGKLYSLGYLFVDKELTSESAYDFDQDITNIEIDLYSAKMVFFASMTKENYEKFINRKFFFTKENLNGMREKLINEISMSALHFVIEQAGRRSYDLVIQRSDKKLIEEFIRNFAYGRFTNMTLSVFRHKSDDLNTGKITKTNITYDTVKTIYNFQLHAKKENYIQKMGPLDCTDRLLEFLEIYFDMDNSSLDKTVDEIIIESYYASIDKEALNAI